MYSPVRRSSGMVNLWGRSFNASCHCLFDLLCDTEGEETCCANVILFSQCYLQRIIEAYMVQWLETDGIVGGRRTHYPSLEMVYFSSKLDTNYSRGLWNASVNLDLRHFKSQFLHCHLAWWSTIRRTLSTCSKMRVSFQKETFSREDPGISLVYTPSLSCVPLELLIVPRKWHHQCRWRSLESSAEGWSTFP